MPHPFKRAMQDLETLIAREDISAEAKVPLRHYITLAQNIRYKTLFSPRRGTLHENAIDRKNPNTKSILQDTYEEARKLREQLLTADRNSGNRDINTDTLYAIELAFLEQQTCVSPHFPSESNSQGPANPFNLHYLELLAEIAKNPRFAKKARNDAHFAFSKLTPWTPTDEEYKAFFQFYIKAYTSDDSHNHLMPLVIALAPALRLHYPAIEELNRHGIYPRHPQNEGNFPTTEITFEESPLSLDQIYKIIRYAHQFHFINNENFLQNLATLWENLDKETSDPTQAKLRMKVQNQILEAIANKKNPSPQDFEMLARLRHRILTNRGAHARFQARRALGHFKARRLGYLFDHIDREQRRSARDSKHTMKYSITSPIAHIGAWAASCIQFFMPLANHRERQNAWFGHKNGPMERILGGIGFIMDILLVVPILLKLLISIGSAVSSAIGGGSSRNTELWISDAMLGQLFRRIGRLADFALAITTTVALSAITYPFVLAKDCLNGLVGYLGESKESRQNLRLDRDFHRNFDGTVDFQKEGSDLQKILGNTAGPHTTSKLYQLMSDYPQGKSLDLHYMTKKAEHNKGGVFHIATLSQRNFFTTRQEQIAPDYEWFPEPSAPPLPPRGSA